MFSNPRVILNAFGISEGMIVGDFGAGTGAYAHEILRHVGDSGVVYAFDVQKSMIDSLVAKARHEKLENIRPIWCDLEHEGGTTLADKTLDSAIIANLLFQIEHKDIFMKEVARVLRPNGRVLIVDWSESFGSASRRMGPHHDHVVSVDDAKAYARSAGLVFDKEIPAGEHHYGLVFRK